MSRTENSPNLSVLFILIVHFPVRGLLSPIHWPGECANRKCSLLRHAFNGYLGNHLQLTDLFPVSRGPLAIVRIDRWEVFVL
jgi:hypothetical protein